jgi:adenylylsulfate kinase-like enzyme
VDLLAYSHTSTSSSIVGPRVNDESAELIADARVVTFTGAGGCGKTRLAVEVAQDLASRFPDGAHWADLQGVIAPAGSRASAR